MQFTGLQSSRERDSELSRGIHMAQRGWGAVLYCTGGSNQGEAGRGGQGGAGGCALPAGAPCRTAHDPRAQLAN